MAKKRSVSRARSPTRRRASYSPRRYHKPTHKVGIGTGLALLYTADQALNTPVSGNNGYSGGFLDWAYRVGTGQTGGAYGVTYGPSLLLSSVKQNWKTEALGLGTALVSTYIGHTSIGRKLRYHSKKWTIGVF